MWLILILSTSTNIYSNTILHKMTTLDCQALIGLLRERERERERERDIGDQQKILNFL